MKKVIKEISKELMADPGARPHHPRAPEVAGCCGDGRLRDPDPDEDQDQARRAVRRPPGDYDKLKRLFAANGIKFAFPTVSVAGGEGDGANPAVAQRALEMTRPETKAAE